MMPDRSEEICGDAVFVGSPGTELVYSPRIAIPRTEPVS